MVTNVVTYIVYNHIMICHPSLKILTLLELLSYFLSAITTSIIIKMTVSLIVIGLKNSYFPLIHLPSCYKTVCYWTVQ